MASLSRPCSVAMDNHQSAGWQHKLRLCRQALQEIMFVKRPLGKDVIVTAYADYPTLTWAHAVDNYPAPHIARVHCDIATGDDVGDSGIEDAVGVTQNGNS